MSFTFFTDRNLGRKFPSILRDAGLHVEEHDDHFGPPTPDVEWSAAVASRNWIAVSRDARIRYKANEQHAVFAAGLRQSEINIAIGAKPPAVYFGELATQANGGQRKYGGITNEVELDANLVEHCIPAAIFDGLADDYDAFLEARRRLMARKIETYFATL